jgi:hypothetical protein
MMRTGGLWGGKMRRNGEESEADLSGKMVYNEDQGVWAEDELAGRRPGWLWNCVGALAG